MATETYAPFYETHSYLSGRLVEFNGFSDWISENGVPLKRVESVYKRADLIFATTIPGQKTAIAWLLKESFEKARTFLNQNSGSDVTFWLRRGAGKSWRWPCSPLKSTKATTCCGLKVGINRLPASPGLAIGFFRSEQNLPHTLGRVGGYWAYTNL